MSIDAIIKAYEEESKTTIDPEAVEEIKLPGQVIDETPFKDIIDPDSLVITKIFEELHDENPPAPHLILAAQGMVRSLQLAFLDGLRQTCEAMPEELRDDFHTALTTTLKIPLIELEPTQESYEDVIQAILDNYLASNTVSAKLKKAKNLPDDLKGALRLKPFAAIAEEYYLNDVRPTDRTHQFQQSLDQRRMAAAATLDIFKTMQAPFNKFTATQVQSLFAHATNSSQEKKAKSKAKPKPKAKPEPTHPLTSSVDPSHFEAVAATIVDNSKFSADKVKKFKELPEGFKAELYEIFSDTAELYLEMNDLDGDHNALALGLLYSKKHRAMAKEAIHSALPYIVKRSIETSMSFLKIRHARTREKA